MAITLESTPNQGSAFGDVLGMTAEQVHAAFPEPKGGLQPQPTVAVGEDGKLVPAADPAQPGDGEQTEPLAPESTQTEEETKTDAAQPAEETASTFTPYQLDDPLLGEIKIESEDQLREMWLDHTRKEEWQKSQTQRDMQIAEMRKDMEQYQPIVNLVKSLPPNSDELAVMKAIAAGYTFQQILEKVGINQDPMPDKNNDPVAYVEWVARQTDRKLAAAQQPRIQLQSQEQPLVNAIVENNNDLLEKTVAEYEKTYGNFLPTAQHKEQFFSKLAEGLKERGFTWGNKPVSREVIDEVVSQKFPKLAESGKKFAEAKRRASKQGRALATPSPKNAMTAKPASRSGSSVLSGYFHGGVKSKFIE